MFCTIANAQILPSYGGERAGQSAFTFLKNDMSVRSAGMGVPPQHCPEIGILECKTLPGYHL